MNPELEKKLLESLDYIGTVVKSGVDLSKSQCPELIKELIQYKTISNVLGIFISLAFLSEFLLLYFHEQNLPLVANRYNNEMEASISAQISMCLSLVAGFVSLMFVIGYIHELIKIKYAQKVYVLEYISSLTNKVR